MIIDRKRRGLEEDDRNLNVDDLLSVDCFMAPKAQRRAKVISESLR